MKLVVNGRFLGRPVTGVDRVASELLRAVRELIVNADNAVSELEVVVPSTVGIDPDKLEEVAGRPSTYRTLGTRGGHGWEQISLRNYRPNAWLLNLCNTAPMFRRRQMVMIYDAQFIEQPESYSWAFRTWYRILLTAVGHRAEIIFTISEASRNALEKHGVVPRGKARVMRLGVDHLDRFPADDGIMSRFDIRPGNYILAIGSLARHKNIPRLVEAFIASGLTDTKLVIAGGGNPNVFQDIGLPVADNVHYLGRVSDAELKSLYANATAFACPSITEGFGLPSLEAMTTGCPVLATTGGAVPEICGDAAYYVDPLDTKAWTAAIRRIVSDRDLRDQMAQKSRKRAAMFTWAGAAQHLLDDLANRDLSQNRRSLN